MDKGILRQSVIAIATGAMLYCNLIVGSGSFSETGSEDLVYYAHPTAFTPAPFTFVVWLPIFLGAVGLASFQALPRNRNHPIFKRIFPFYLVALIANSIQVFTPLGWSNAVVLILFFSLAFTLRELVGAKRESSEMIWLVNVPVAMFATWAGLAMVLNFCQLVVAVGGSVDAGTAAILVAFAMATGAYAIWRTREYAILAVMIWAGAGIFASNQDSLLVTTTVVLTTIVSVATAVLTARCNAKEIVETS